MKKDFLNILYNGLCKEHQKLENDYFINPTKEKRIVLTLLKSEIYNIDRKLQER